MRRPRVDVQHIRELRYQDGLSCPVVAQMVGCSESTVRYYAPGQPGKVPNDLLRAAFETSPMTAAELARAMGWWAPNGPYPEVGDSSRVKRSLGLQVDVNGNGKRSVRTMIDAEMAGLMAEALGLGAWEIMPDEELMAA